MSPSHADDIVKLTTAPNPAQAHIWEQALKEEGIKAKVVGDYLDASFGDLPGTKPEIWVHRDDVARAEEILHEGEEEALVEDEEVPEES